MLRGFVSLAIVAAIVLKVGAGRLWAAVGGVDPKYLLLAVLLAVPRYMLKVTRWKLLATRSLKSLTWLDATTSLLVGTAGAVVTPGRLGQVSSAFALGRGNRLALSGLSMVDLGSDFLVVAMLSLGVLLEPVVGIILAISIVAIALSGSALARLFPQKEGRIGQVRRGVELLDFRTMASVLFLAVLVYAFNLLQFHLVLTAYVSVPFLVSVKSLPLIFLAVALPVAIGGLGVREATAAVVLASFGVEEAIAVQAAFQLFVINMLLPALLGAAVAGHRGARLKKEGVR